MNENQKKATGVADQDVSLTRRALIKARWAIPAVLALTPPKNVFANTSGPILPGGGD